MLISVIIPAYNSIKYLYESVNSVLRCQDSRLELIIVNDGSTDGTSMVCDNLCKIDKRIRVIHKENGGLSSARNAGIKIAQGKYITFLDSDDVIITEELERAIEYISKRNSDCFLFSYVRDMKYLNQNTDLGAIDYEYREFRYNLLTTNKYNHAWGRFYRLELIVNNDISFIDQLYYVEDIIFNISFFNIANNCEVFSNPLVKYRITEGSITNTFKYKIFESLAMQTEFRKKYSVIWEMGNECESDINLFAFIELYNFIKKLFENKLFSKYIIQILGIKIFEEIISSVCIAKLNTKQKIIRYILSKKWTVLFSIFGYVNHMVSGKIIVDKFSCFNTHRQKLKKEKSLYIKEKGILNEVKLRLLNDHDFQIWKYVFYMRKEEYYDNRTVKLMKYYYARKRNSLGAILGITIWPHTISEGLKIWHYGCVIVNGHAYIGENCQFHGDNCVGNKGEKNETAPYLGKNIDIGVGAKIIGGIYLADNITIGANAVVTKSFYEPGVTLIGSPAYVLKK